MSIEVIFFFQAEDGIRDIGVTGVQTCALPISREHGVLAAASAEEAVRGADVVVTATTSPTPVLSGRWLSPGAHINAVGAPRPDWRELDDEGIGRSLGYVGSPGAALEERGEVIVAGGGFRVGGEGD